MIDLKPKGAEMLPDKKHKLIKDRVEVDEEGHKKQLEDASDRQLYWKIRKPIEDFFASVTTESIKQYADTISRLSQPVTLVLMIIVLVLVIVTYFLFN